jgi:stage V sporulation protein S
MTAVVMTEDDDKVLRVSASSNANSLASAISHAVYDGQEVVLRAIGAGAVNQAVKAIAIARSFVAPRSIDLHCIPGFATVEMPDKAVISAVVFHVFPAKH